ncbi:MAG: glycosyltransferase [Desulforhabdus sp.]|nr:glycosyltransferase [Desulforhabdus sp.]
MKQKALKIAMISIHSDPLGELGTRDTGGMSVYVREIGRRLAEMGNSVDIFTRVDRLEGVGTIRPFENFRIIHLPAGPAQPLPQLILFRYLAEFFRNLDLLKQREGTGYDVVHTHYWLSGQIGRWTRKRWQVPHVFMFHTLGALKNRVFGSEQEPDLRIRVENRLTAECDLISAGTTRDKEQIIEHYGAASERIQVVPCGVDLECFRPSARSHSRTRLGLTRGERVVLYVGRFDPIKGVDRLLRAAAGLRREFPLQVLLVGGGEPASSDTRMLRNLCVELSLQDCVTFAGRKTHADLPDYYRAADVLVLPSYYESFGLVVLEALACGTPVVAAPVGVVPDLVRSGVNGWVVADNTPEHLADGVRRVLHMRNERRWPIETIRQAAANYDWSHVAASIEVQYRGLLSKKAALCHAAPESHLSRCGQQLYLNCR